MFLSKIGQNIKVSFEHKCLILIAEPQAHIETWEDEEDAYLARAVYEHMQLNDGQVWQPQLVFVYTTVNGIWYIYVSFYKIYV